MRFLLLSGSVLAALVISACAEDPNDNASNSSVKIVDAKTEIAPQNDSVIKIAQERSPETKNTKANSSILPENIKS